MMITNRRKFVKTGIASVAGAALAGNAFALWHADIPAPKVSELTKLDGDQLKSPDEKSIIARVGKINMREPVIFYVSSKGNDKNDGTAPSTAWRTIERVNGVHLFPGDTILFEGGKSFKGNLLVTHSGTAAAFITIGSYGEGKATILAGDSYAIQLLNCQYIKVRDLILLGSGVKSNGETTNDSLGLDIYSTVTVGNPWQSIYVDKLIVSGFRTGILMHTPLGTQDVVGFNDVRITNCIIKECQYGGFYCVGSKRVSRTAKFLPPLGAGTFTNCYLGGCTIHDIYADPFSTGSSCRPLTIYNGTNFLVEHNTIHHIGQAQRAGSAGIGGLCFLESDNCIAQFNICHHVNTNVGFDGCAFDIDGGCTNCILQYNYSYDNDGAGYQAGTFSGCSPTHDNAIRYNISQNDSKKGPLRNGGIMTWGNLADTRTHIYNNTVFISAGIDGTKPAAFLGQGSGVTLCNNIFVTNHDGEIVNIFKENSYKMLNNCYYRTRGDFNVLYVKKHFNTLAEWQETTDQEKLSGDPVGFATNPQFRNPGSADSIADARELSALNAYDLLPSSPLIEKGLDLQSLFGFTPGLFDFRGARLRFGGRYDMGAVEHK